jgi:hypothetical protein
MCTIGKGFKLAKARQQDALNPKSLSASFRFRYGYKRLEQSDSANSILPFRSNPEGQIRYLAVLKANTGIDENNPEVARILEIDRNYGRSEFF